MDLKESGTLAGDPADHWYFASKARAVVRTLGRSVPRVVLDVGAGAGFFSKHVLQHTAAAEVWSVDSGYSRDWDETVGEGGKVVHFRRAIGPVDAGLVLLMDVLEHVDDDVGLLREYAAKVPSGTRFLITVPAFAFLWSAHDEFLEHRRRYTLRQLESVVRAAGLEVASGHYYFAAAFPAAAATRLVSRNLAPPRSLLVRHGRFVNGVLRAISGAELSLMRFNRLFGLTVVCVAQKP